jgi:uncharacterized protein YecE (DUF72 family)
MIRVGIGGWNFAPWRGVFYPADLPHARELDFASRQLSSIEINSTFYRTQAPESYRRWRDATPDDFCFSLKASRASTYRKDPADAAPSIARFLGSGITQLGTKLGPILWQFAPTRKFDRAEVESFLELLPPHQDDLPLRHAIEARHASFGDGAYFELLRQYGVAHAIIDSDKQALAGEITADFVYARLERCQESETAGYAPAALDLWAARCRDWAAGRQPSDLPAATPLEAKPRDCFVYVISGAKVRAPAAAMALMQRFHD